jgi:hypothetical protein
MMVELKPCPFCGGRNVCERADDGYVSCADCHTYGPAGSNPNAAWNTRAILSTGDDAGLVERLNEGVLIIGSGPGQSEMIDVVTANQAMRRAAAAILSLTARNKALVGTVHNAWLQWKAGEWTAEEALTALFDEIVCPPINHQDNRQKEGGE